MIRDDENLPRLFRRLWGQLPQTRQTEIFVLLSLSILTSFAEALSLGAVMPFIGVLSASETVLQQAWGNQVWQLLGRPDVPTFQWTVTLVFASLILLAASLRLLVLWWSNRVAAKLGSDFSISMFQQTLDSGYSFHLEQNRSNLITSISRKGGDLVSAVWMPFMRIVSGMVLLASVGITLSWIDPAVTLAAVFGFGFIYAVVTYFSRMRVRIWGAKVAQERVRVMTLLQEGLGGIRQVILANAQPFFMARFARSDVQMRQALGNANLYGESPRHGVEALGILLIAGVTYTMVRRPHGLTEALPVLGVFALGAQKMLPVLQQIYASITSIRAAQASLQDALDLMGNGSPIPLAPIVPMPFVQGIALRGVSFRYHENEPWVMKDVDLHIDKGARVGIIGASGTGKSTLVDILMGLLQPTHGELWVDNQEVTGANARDWYPHVGHVPQSIHLGNGTVAQIVAFGVEDEDIDIGRVEQVLGQACLSQRIAQMAEGVHSSIGEGGSKLSGGEQQRLAIARALYAQADVLVFDEATHALDEGTEREVLKALAGLPDSITQFFITHRKDALEQCTHILEVQEDGNVQLVSAQQFNESTNSRKTTAQ